MARHIRSRRNRSGQAGLLVVLNLALLFGTLGLAVDVGWGYFTRQAAQTAADAAALAAAAYASASGTPACGSGGVICGSSTACPYPLVNPPTNNLQAGCMYASENGFVNSGSQSVSMLANTTAPPGVGGNTPNYWVQAKVTAKPYTLFGSFGGVTRFTINAQATAGVTYLQAGACIYVLDSTAHQAFSATGASVTTATCGIFVNSNATDAFYTSGSAHVTSTQILVNGGTSLGSSTVVSPTPTTNAGAQNDPLSSISMPTFANTCDFTAYTLGNSNTATLNPGTYCDGIKIQGAAHATFNAGLYVVNGTGVSFANSAVVTGSGVTFFITGQYGHTAGPVTNTGATTITLSAPSSGTNEGMLFIQDRNLTYSTGNSFANSSSSVLQGTLYFPTTNLSYTGASATGTYTAIIAKKVALTGSASFKNDPTGTYTGLATTIRSLIQ